MWIIEKGKATLNTSTKKSAGVFAAPYVYLYLCHIPDLSLLYRHGVASPSMVTKHDGMKKTLLTVILFLHIALSQSSTVKFYNINTMYGISMREAASVCCDKDGFIWAACKTGIMRLTEDDHRIYQLPYEAADYQTTKLIYTQSSLIAYTNNGQIFRYNPVFDKFDLVINLRMQNNAKYMNIHKLAVDAQGTYWIASSYGLHKLQNKTLTRVSETSDENFDVCWFDDSLLLSADKKGIWQTNVKTQKRICIYKNTIIDPFQVSSLYYDVKTKKLWIGTLSNGLFGFDFQSKTVSPVQKNALPKQPILALESNSDSTLLIGIDGQGIWEWNKKTDKIQNVYKQDANNTFSLKGDGVYDIFCDQKKRVWVCTYSGGVSFYDQSSPLVSLITHDVNTLNSLNNNDVNKIIEDRSGNIWFATDNGISCWDKKNNKWKIFYSNKKEQAQVFLSLCEDNEGRVWAGSYSSGVYVIDEKTGREVAHYYKNDNKSIMNCNYVFDIMKDSQGDIWIGGVQGDIFCYQSKEKKFRSYGGQSTNVFVEVSPMQILSVSTFGLSMINKKTGEEKVLVEGFTPNDAVVVGNDAWVCTRGDGLIRFDLKTKQIEKFTLKIGLPSNYINSVMKDGDNLWLGTENGLCRFNLKNKSVNIYSSLLTLAHISFNSASHCKLLNGDWIWGTNNGAISFNPTKIQKDRQKGKIFFQDLTIAGRSIRDSSSIKLEAPLDSLKEITLKYDQNTFTLELLPLGLSSTDSKFSWRMEGLEAKWNLPVTHRIITYTSLPSGTFHLKVRLYDSSMSRVICERKITIRVTPPFWRSWWFILILSMFFTSIFYLIFRLYIDRLNKLHTEEKIRFFTNTTHDMRTSLTLINAPISELVKEKNLSETGRYYLHLAAEQSRRLASVVTQLMDFQKADIGKEQLVLRMVDIVQLVAQRRLMYESFARSKNIDIDFTSNQTNYITALDEQKMNNVIDNLISNAVKYSKPDSRISINLVCSEKNWALEVSDQGIGISDKAQRQLFREFYRGENAINSKIIGSGIGLLSVKNYVSLHKGKVSCTSQENVGSSFKVVIPFAEVQTAVPPLVKEEPAMSMQAIVEPNAGDANIKSKQKEMKILIVEDNDDLRNFMQIPLGEEFEIITAEDGVKAWKIIEKEMPDLIVSDVMMPNMDGFELCKLAKSTYETSHIPIILLTALSDKAEQLHGLGLGADDYLTKPFDMSLLTQKIKSIILNRDAVRERALKLIKANSQEPILANENNDKFLKKALETIHSNMSNPLFGKEEFASAMNVSTSLLYKKIKAITDQSPSDFIKSIRLTYALELLRSRKHNVTEVSELCGFSSIGYFSTVFKKHYGKPPTDIMDL